ncbi:translation initiation factor IF-2-like [Prionailurus viverrinus]|uniref:translation initiation factor IF-2-like n=1 Tax=Prionailurus viverrinus TaxID=61388 RepID=UPI001FF63E36|nr:translation initiation factor IF-2-like [Prionailurus viverrinus]
MAAARRGGASGQAAAAAARRCGPGPSARRRRRPGRSRGLAGGTGGRDWRRRRRGAAGARAAATRPAETPSPQSRSARGSRMVRPGARQRRKGPGDPPGGTRIGASDAGPARGGRRGRRDRRPRRSGGASVPRGAASPSALPSRRPLAAFGSPRLFPVARPFPPQALGLGTTYSAKMTVWERFRLSCNNTPVPAPPLTTPRGLLLN